MLHSSRPNRNYQNLFSERERPSFKDCSKCGRRNNKRHSKCLYCGEIMLTGPFD
mgnify:CR=1 FL=1